MHVYTHTPPRAFFLFLSPSPSLAPLFSPVFSLSLSFSPFLFLVHTHTLSLSQRRTQTTRFCIRNYIAHRCFTKQPIERECTARENETCCGGRGACSKSVSPAALSSSCACSSVMYSHAAPPAISAAGSSSPEFHDNASEHAPEIGRDVTASHNPEP